MAESPVAPVLQMLPGTGLSKNWDTSGEYSEDAVYLRGTDKEGHSEKPRVNVPPHMWAEVCAIVATGKTPYRTPIDMMRDGLYHRLHYWREKLPDLDWRAFDVEEALARSERRQAAQISRKALVESHETGLKRAYEDKDWPQLVECLEGVVADADNLPEPYMSRCLGLAEEYRQKLHDNR